MKMEGRVSMVRVSVHLVTWVICASLCSVTKSSVRTGAPVRTTLVCVHLATLEGTVNFVNSFRSWGLALYGISYS